MATPKFYRKDGLLTAYALACGYVEFFDRGDLSTRMYKSIGVYTVRTRDMKSFKVIEEDFRELAKARKAYARQRRLKEVPTNSYAVNGEVKEA